MTGGETEAQRADSCSELEEEQNVPGPAGTDGKLELVFIRSGEAAAH